MTLYEELYFDVTLRGPKSELKKFVSVLRSGEFDDFFEITSDYIIYDDSYDGADDATDTEIIFTNDDYGIEIEEFDTDEFLEVFCKAAKKLDVYGTLFDAEDGEWYGYLHYDNSVSTTLKGNIFKGPFHIPRLYILMAVLDECSDIRRYAE